MEREDKGILLVGAGVLAALVGLIFSWKKRGFGAQPKDHFARITVRADGSVTYSPETIEGVSRGRGDMVIWRLRNESQQHVEVCVGKFKNETTGSNEDPLDAVGKGGKCRRLHPGGQGTIPAKVRGFATKGTYKYSILVNPGEEVDPRLAIVD